MLRNALEFFFKSSKDPKFLKLVVFTFLQWYIVILDRFQVAKMPKAATATALLELLLLE
jgi:hypothetical protein